MITIEYLQYEDAYKGYSPLRDYIFLDTIDDIDGCFDRFLVYCDGEAWPFSDEDSTKFLEHLHNTPLYKSHGFRRIGAFAFSANGVIYSLTHLDIDIKVALLILKYRSLTNAEGIIINPCFLCSEPYRWLAEHYDLKLCIKPSDIIHSKFPELQNTQFEHAEKAIENIQSWLTENVIHRREYDNTFYGRHNDNRFISVWQEEPTSFKKFCTELNKKMLFRLETHDIDPCCDEYTVFLSHKYFSARIDEWTTHPVLYCIIEKDKKGRFMQSDVIINSNISMLFDMIVRIFKDENADMATFVISSEPYNATAEINDNNILQTIAIQRKSKIILMMHNSLLLLNEAMKRTGISHEQVPEAICLQ